MRILLAHNSTYYPAHGGGDKSNRLLVEALAARGHECRVVARTATFGEAAQREFLAELAGRGVRTEWEAAGAVSFQHNGVEVRTLANRPNIRGYFVEQISAFRPGVILTSTDDPAQLLFEAALRAPAARVVYLARATLALPFGPDCAFPGEAKTNALRQADAVVGVSEYVAAYIRKHSGIPAVHVPISLMEPQPAPALGRLENEFVTLVNPCAVKGIAIFLALADALPDVAFAAVPTWGTNHEDCRALEARPNVRVLKPVDSIDDLMARTRVLLVPSLWAEARSRIIVEAMLRGVPVLASNVGGIPEAKMGVPYLLDVRPIEKYEARVDEQMVPVADVPPQDIGPWREALCDVLSSPARYAEISGASRAAAVPYVANLSVGPFEELLVRVAGESRRSAAAPYCRAVAPLLDGLSPERRKLLELRLKRLAPAGPPARDPWLGSVDRAARLRLFCFPHAGGGSSAFAGWADCLPKDVAICPVRLPGRERRAAEAPFRDMDALVEALCEVLQPHLDVPFAFYGHSMGAAVGFELARCLRRSKLPLPVALLVSSARAPRFRLNHVPPPEPTEEAFLDELRRLEGVSRELLEHEELLRLVMPALRADTALYRNYIYHPEAPLPFPICAYGGERDPNIRREHLEAWDNETSAGFSLRVFPGGHFFGNTSRTPFLASLASDLNELA